MPSHATLEAFIARVESNAHADAIEAFYTVGATLRDNMASPRVGRDSLVAHEHGVLARAIRVSSRCVRPVFVAGDNVVVRWVFDFTRPDGDTTRIEDLAYQLRQAERIVEEQFFHDPIQLTSRAAIARDA